jgi:2-phosphosulfolactate phosphatase
VIQVDVVPTADAAVPDDVRGRTVLMVDVLRASTTMITALAHGALAIVPVTEPAEAERRAAALGRPGVILAGERRGEMIPGFDAGNSPVAFASESVRGCTIVFTTSNGTRALAAAREAAAIGIAGLVNVSAAAAWAATEGRDITVVCAGDRGRVSLEDTVCAGHLVDRLAAAGDLTGRAEDAVATARRYGKDMERLALESPWASRLVRAGHGADVAACLALDTSPHVPRYLPDVDKVVLTPR